MESKKVKKVELQSKRTLFQAIGVLLSLSFVLLAFEWNFSSSVEGLSFDSGSYIDEDPIPITRVKEKPKPPKLNKQVKFEVVENKVDVADNNLDKFNSETDPNEILADPFGDDGEGEVFIDNTPLPPFDPSVLEHRAKFPGGEKALLKFIRDNTIYPEEQKELGISGVVWIKFVINPKGKVTDVNVLRSPDRALSKSAVRTIKLLPNFKPAKQNGQKVSMYYTIPIKFILH